MSRRSVKRLQFVSELLQKIRGFKALRLKLLSEAQASIRVPSTVKCSSLVSLSSPRSGQRTFRTGEPTAEQVKAATEELAQDAVTPFLNARFRRRILELRQQNEQTIDRHTIDEVLYSGFDAAALEKAQAKIRDFREWIKTYRDELTALQV